MVHYYSHDIFKTECNIFIENQSSYKIILTFMYIRDNHIETKGVSNSDLNSKVISTHDTKGTRIVLSTPLKYR